MKNYFAAAMRKAAGLTRAGSVVEATRTIQAALGTQGQRAPDNDEDADGGPPKPQQPPALRLIDSGVAPAASQPDAERSATGIRLPEGLQRLRKPLGEVLQLLRARRLATQAPAPLPGLLPRTRKTGSPPPMPEGAQFVTRSFACAAGGRDYMLYLPASAPHAPRGLVVMLHGCKQDPSDFARGTNMNAVAEAHGLLVAYPSQPAFANASACWNWFNPADQARGAGEPSIIAGLTQELMAEFGLERTQVFAAGLSAGGAMAAVMGETYPDIYAAVGIHSGLPYKSANDVMSAFAAMRGDSGLAPRLKPRGAKLAAQAARTIVFQGSADQTVHASNAEKIVAAARADMASASVREERGSAAGGRPYSRKIIAGPDNSPAVEYWLIDGAGHAWSGGDAAGSYADPEGPDASAEMVRFFLAEAPSAERH